MLFFGGAVLGRSVLFFLLERGVLFFLLERGVLFFGRAVFDAGFFCARAPVFAPICPVRRWLLLCRPGFFAGAVRTFRAGFGDRDDLVDTERFFFVLFRGTVGSPPGEPPLGTEEQLKYQ